MLEEREIGIDKVNKLFGTNIKVRKASSWKLVEEEMENTVEETDENSDKENVDNDENVKEEREDETDS